MIRKHGCFGKLFGWNQFWSDEYKHSYFLVYCHTAFDKSILQDKVMNCDGFVRYTTNTPSMLAVAGVVYRGFKCSVNMQLLWLPGNWWQTLLSNPGINNILLTQQCCRLNVWIYFEKTFRNSNMKCWSLVHNDAIGWDERQTWWVEDGSDHHSILHSYNITCIDYSSISVWQNVESAGEMLWLILVLEKHSEL